MGKRFTGLLTVSASLSAATLLAAACTASPPHSASSATRAAIAADRSGDAPALIVQCALTRGLLKPPTGIAPMPAGVAPFVQGTKLEITSGNAGIFNSWYTGIDATWIAGQRLENWVQQTASSGKLPAAVCGTSVTASELQKRVFAGDPAADDPW